MRRYAVATVGRTHVGLVKPNNEDAFHIGPVLVLVADGVGGSAAGEVASRTVVDTFAAVEREALARSADQQRDPDDPVDDIYAVLSAAVERSTDSLNEQVEADPALDGMGTTITAMMWSGRRIVFAQIGDSRGYYLADGAPGAETANRPPGDLEQITKDDSFVQYLIDRGMLDPAEATRHPRRNVILKALNGATVSPSLRTFAPRIGDRYLLCSDGLSDYVPAATIAETIRGTDADSAADRLIELSLAAGAPDNVTVLIADVVPATPDPAVPA